MPDPIILGPGRQIKLSRIADGSSSGQHSKVTIIIFTTAEYSNVLLILNGWVGLKNSPQRGNNHNYRTVRSRIEWF